MFSFIILFFQMSSIFWDWPGDYERFIFRLFRATSVITNPITWSFGSTFVDFSWPKFNITLEWLYILWWWQFPKFYLYAMFAQTVANAMNKAATSNTKPKSLMDTKGFIMLTKKHLVSHLSIFSVFIFIIWSINYVKKVIHFVFNNKNRNCRKIIA